MFKSCCCRTTNSEGAIVLYFLNAFLHCLLPIPPLVQVGPVAQMVVDSAVEDARQVGRREDVDVSSRSLGLQWVELGDTECAPGV